MIPLDLNNTSDLIIFLVVFFSLYSISFLLLALFYSKVLKDCNLNTEVEVEGPSLPYSQRGTKSPIND